MNERGSHDLGGRHVGDDPISLAESLRLVQDDLGTHTADGSRTDSSLEGVSTEDLVHLVNTSPTPSEQEDPQQMIPRTEISGIVAEGHQGKMTELQAKKNYWQSEIDKERARQKQDLT